MPEFDPTILPGASSEAPHGGRLAAAALREGGVDTIFALCGGHILGLLDGCVDEGIRVIDVRHEGAASLAAEGWALATGRTGVAAVTAGPGFGNALTGFIDAGVWTLPMVLLAGRTGVAQQGRGAVMDVDQRGIVAPVAKWSATCLATPRIPAVIAEALHRARAGKPGPVYVEIPQDIFMASAEPDSPRAAAGVPSVAPAPAGDPAEIARALDVLQRAERPLLIAGGGAFWSDAGDALARFAETASIPVATTSAARGLLPDSHEWCLGSLVHAGVAALAADVVVVAGSAFNANMAFGQPPLIGPAVTVVQIDIRPEAIGGNRAADIGIAGDAARVLGGLADGWTKTPDGRDAWLAQARELAGHGLAAWDAQIDGYTGPGIHCGAVARTTARVLRETCGGDVTFVADGGDALSWGLAYGYAEGPGRMMTTTTALGTLGVGMPFAIGAAAARPGEPVVLLTGDGSFGLTAMEVDTAARHGLPVIAIVSNNGSWGDVVHEQRAWYGRETASALRGARYDVLGEALGARGWLVESFEAFEPALREALASGGPCVIDVRTDPEILSDLLRNLSSMNLM
ncbi:MAG TPA: thiamine pyrophosphate-binding protein [Actinomycetota bacterium]|nr:thiamine pyrophosphate-binding protein [Actinomycetota bacterium]